MRALRCTFVATLSLLPALFVGSACADFDREDRIEDLRVLAVRTEPAEVLYHPIYGLLPPDQRPPPPFFSAPSYDVDVEVYAYDPRGGRIITSTQLCPASAGACLNFDPASVLANEPASAAEELLAVHEPRISEVDLEPARDGPDPTGRIPSLSYRFTLTPAVIDSIVPNTASGQPVPSFFAELPRIAVDVQNLDVDEVARESAYKRLPVQIDVAHPDLSPDFRRSFEQILGVRYCESVIPDDEFEEGRTDCVEPRGPNQNPNLLGFDLDREDELRSLEDEGIRFATSSDLGRSSLLRVPRGGRVHLTPVFPPGDREHYQIISFDVDSQTLFAENRWEDYVVSWYTTRGDVSDPLTELQFGGRLGVTWQLPRNVESGERDTIVAVVRDQRGGTTVGQVVVEYR